MRAISGAWNGRLSSSKVAAPARTSLDGARLGPSRMRDDRSLVPPLASLRRPVHGSGKASKQVSLPNQTQLQVPAHPVHRKSAAYPYPSPNCEPLSKPESTYSTIMIDIVGLSNEFPLQVFSHKRPWRSESRSHQDGSLVGLTLWLTNQYTPTHLHPAGQVSKTIGRTSLV
jgi:hypothetical protein